MPILRPPWSRALDRRTPILVAFATLLLVASAVLVLACGGASSPPRVVATYEPGLDLPPTAVPTADAGPSEPSDEATSDESSDEAPPEDQAEAPPPPEVRENCAVIRGSDYRSPEERDWFFQNCLGRPGSAPAVASGGPGPSAPVGPQSPMGDRLSIPAAGVNAEVWRATVPSGGQMPDPTGYFNVVWYDFRNLPGLGGYVDSGNLVVAGHVDCARCVNGGSGTAVFYGIRTLKAGDTASYRTASGSVVNYVVTSSRSYGLGSNWEAILGAGTADMTLITCTGTFSGGEYSLRHIVALRKA